MGCIRKLKVGRRLVELHEGQDVMVERVVGIRECGENPCSSLPCLHGATCHAIDSDKFQCACTQEFTGQNNIFTFPLKQHGCGSPTALLAFTILNIWSGLFDAFLFLYQKNRETLVTAVVCKFRE
jgi:hypothetical protein